MREKEVEFFGVLESPPKSITEVFFVFSICFCYSNQYRQIPDSENKQVDQSLCLLQMCELNPNRATTAVVLTSGQEKECRKRRRTRNGWIRILTGNRVSTFGLVSLILSAFTPPTSPSPVLFF